MSHAETGKEESGAFPSPRRPNLPPYSAREVVQATLTVAAVLFAFWLLYRYLNVVLILFAAIIVGTAVRPVGERLSRRGVPRPASIILVYGLLVLVLVLVAILVVPILADQVTRIGDALPGAYQQLRDNMLASPHFLVWRLATEMPQELSMQPAPPGETEAAESLSQGLQILGIAARSLFAGAAVLVLAFYWALDGQKAVRSVLLLTAPEQREEIRRFVGDSEGRISAYLTGQLLLCLIIGALMLVVYMVLGLPYALALAIIAGLLEAVPLIGPILGAIPAVLVAYSVDPTKALWVIVASLVVQQLESQLLVPRVMKRSVGVHPLLTLLALLALGTLFGVPGMLVAIPLAAIAQLAIDRRRATVEEQAMRAPPGQRDRLAVLHYEVRELIQDMRKIVRNKDDQPSSASDQVEETLETIASNLDEMLAAARENVGEL
jgi:predicted PurR-regulated permease PerM